jgi:hypothetical protein
VSELEIKTSLEVYRAIHKTESHWSESDVICDMNNRKNNEGNISDGISNKKELVAEGIMFAKENESFLKRRWVSLDSLKARDAQIKEKLLKIKNRVALDDYEKTDYLAALCDIEDFTDEALLLVEREEAKMKC